jgi:hypothetical protein
MALGQYKKLKKISLILVLLTSGCASQYRLSDPAEIELIPDDCKNQKIITNFLNPQLDYNKPFTQKEEEYDKQISAIKNKIWRLRYRCNPV